jgi:hypothetical protein
MDASDRTQEANDKLAKYYRSISPLLQPVRADLTRARKEESDVLKDVPTTLVLKELAEPRVTHIHKRGDFLRPGPVVMPAVPEIFPPLAGEKTNRLSLAKWLVDPGNPLTARVIVNRIWQMHFGQGLVKTAEDFGTQGERPSHPELLDWLATEFVQLHWDCKALHRLIVTAATYRQSSRISAAKLQADPENRLLARGPRFRLPAELIRDNALEIAGLLSRKIGGPSVFPYQPPGLWGEVGILDLGVGDWVVSPGEESRRRGLYTFWRRSIPYPAFAVFDAPSREHCTVRRLASNTPLQALVTLNDPVFFGAARGLARRILREGGSSTESRIDYGIRLCLARHATAPEIERLLEFADLQSRQFSLNCQAAERVTAADGPSVAADDPINLAVWTMIANVLLNLDGVFVQS